MTTETIARTKATCAYPNDREAAHDHADCEDALATVTQLPVLTTEQLLETASTAALLSTVMSLTHRVHAETADRMRGQVLADLREQREMVLAEVTRRCER